MMVVFMMGFDVSFGGCGCLWWMVRTYRQKLFYRLLCGTIFVFELRLAHIKSLQKLLWVYKITQIPVSKIISNFVL